MSNEATVMVCEECDLECCEYRGVSPLIPDDQKSDAYTCTLLRDDKRSCLVSIPTGVMVDTATGNARTVRVDFVRVWKARKWMHKKL